MTDVEIIDFEPRYRADFERLNVEWLERYFHVEPIDRKVLGDPQTHVLSGGGSILFARNVDGIVGTVALIHHGDGNFELTKMAVTAAAQGGGIGRALLAAAIERFADRGGCRLFLESHSSLGAALSLYRRAGFLDEEPPAPSEYARADVYMVYRPAQSSCAAR